MCRSKQRGFRSRTKAKKGQSQQTHRVDAADTGEDESSDTPYSEPMFNVSGRELAPPIVVTVEINNAKLEMEGDTGASASIISNQTYTQLWPEPQRPRLQQSTKKLRTYTGEQLKLEDYITVEVSYGSQTQTLPLLVVAGNGPSLLGRDWMMKIRLDWHSLHCVQAATPSSLQAALDSHPSVFKDELGRTINITAKIFVNPGAQPRFCKPRSIPFALQAEVNSELERLAKAGVIEPVTFSDWAAPIVPVLKPDGSVRICGDYKCTVNQAAMDSYPLPKIDDLFASLAGEIFKT